MAVCYLDLATNCPLHVRFYTTRTKPFIKMLISQLSKKLPVDAPIFFVDGDPRVAADLLSSHT